MHISLIWLFSFTLSFSLYFLPHSRLLLNLLFLLSSDIYIPRICDKPIWQLNLHPLYYQSSPCLGHSALQQYILIIVIYSFSKSAGTYLFNFLHYCHHLAVLLLLLGILCVCVCVCVCVLSTILSVFGVILIGYLLPFCCMFLCLIE